MLETRPPGQSLVNPFDQADVADFNFMFYVMLAVLAVYGYMATPVANGFYGAARTPHEAKIARMLAMWRYAVVYLLVMMMPIVAYVLLHSNAAPATADQVQAALAHRRPQVREQLTVPVTMTTTPSHRRGRPVRGGDGGGDRIDRCHLPSFVGQRICPGCASAHPRPRIVAEAASPLAAAIDLRCCRVRVVLQHDVSAARIPVHVRGDHRGDLCRRRWAVVIGGLYWKSGTTAGAWTAMIVGAVLAVAGIVLTNVVWPHVLPGLKSAHPAWGWLQALPETFWLNGMHLSVITAFCRRVQLYRGIVHDTRWLGI